MPVIYYYLGTKIYVYLADHEPVHFHAQYKDAEITFYFTIDNNVIIDIQYVERRGSFPVAELHNLKIFVEEYKYALLMAWKQIHNDVRIQPVRITKKIK